MSCGDADFEVPQRDVGVPRVSAWYVRHHGCWDSVGAAVVSPDPARHFGEVVGVAALKPVGVGNGHRKFEILFWADREMREHPGAGRGVLEPVDVAVRQPACGERPAFAAAVLGRCSAIQVIGCRLAAAEGS